MSNRLKTTVRHIWRNKKFTVLNMIGLSIGISACWMIYRINSHEFSYEEGISDLENIYRIVTQYERDGNTERSGGTAPPLYQGIHDELTGWKQVIPLSYQWIEAAEVRRSDGSVFSKVEADDVVRTKPEYFEMVPHRWLAGSMRTALSAPDQVVLTESRAREYFPDTPLEEILGKQITYFQGDTLIHRVSGIVGDLTFPSEFRGKEFWAMENRDFRSGEWTNTNGNDKVYVQLDQKINPGGFLKQVQDMSDNKRDAFARENDIIMSRTKSYELLPLQDSHFATHVKDLGFEKMNVRVLYGLMGIGGFLLLLACINYINMSVAQIPQRSKEIGIRKTLGSSPVGIIGQFLLETMLTVLLAVMVSLVWSSLGFMLLQDLLPPGVHIDLQWESFALFAVLIIVLLTFVAGLYPAWLITKVKTVEVFKNQFLTMGKGHRVSLQKVLIVFQFTIAIAFALCAIIVGTQLRHTLKSNLGFDKEAVVHIEVPFRYWYNNPVYANKHLALADELEKQPGIAKLSLGTPPLSNGYSSSPFSAKGNDSDPFEVILYKKSVDEKYIDLYDIRLLGGRNLRNDIGAKEVLLNESAVRTFGFNNVEDALGRTIGPRTNEEYLVVGIVEDFHTQDFRTSITPTILLPSRLGGNDYTFNVKLVGQASSEWVKTLKAIEDSYASIYPRESFAYTFYDTTIQAMYEKERNLGRLINIATVITILISCLGLFGLATLTAFQRTKEIGIRKVLGASVAGIVTMLSKDFVKLVCLAMIIASPLAWWAMNTWLDDFVYRIAIEWWMFLGAGLLAILTALLTVSWQAIRAALANPVDSLRDE